MNIPIETVQVGDFQMNYFRFGSGQKTMVILPGLSVQSVMGFAESVAAEYEVMTNDFTVYVFDRRSELPKVYSVDEMARDTAEAFKALGLCDIYLFGASQGGMMAMRIAVEYPGLVRRLALGSTSPHLKEQQLAAMGQWLDLARQKDGEGLYLAFGEKLYPPEMFARSREMLALAGRTVTDEEFARFAVLADGTNGFDMTGSLHRIACPVLAIGSQDDRVVGPEGTEAIVRVLGGRQDFETYMYDGFGHAAYDTAPDYRQRIYDFFMR